MSQSLGIDKIKNRAKRFQSVLAVHCGGLEYREVFLLSACFFEPPLEFVRDKPQRTFIVPLGAIGAIAVLLLWCLAKVVPDPIRGKLFAKGVNLVQINRRRESKAAQLRLAFSITQ